jgi:putative restriction endonuclease
LANSPPGNAAIVARRLRFLIGSGGRNDFVGLLHFAVIEAYSCRCAVCGLKINSPDSLSWEVEAAHIVPNRWKGRDDIFNGIAMCRIHHWAFDVGWFTLLDDYKIQASPQLNHLPLDFGKIEGYDFFRALTNKSLGIRFPGRPEIRPHQNAIRWHRQNIFHQ